MKKQEVKGLYFEELEMGGEMSSPGRTVTEADVTLFTGVSGDYNQLHTDAEFAKESPFGQRVAHGLLGLAMASGLATRLGVLEGTAIALLSLEWKFKAPIFIGDTIALFAKVAGKKAMRPLGGGIVTLEASLVNQRHETVQKGEWRVLVKSKEAQGS